MNEENVNQNQPEIPTSPKKSRPIWSRVILVFVGVLLIVVLVFLWVSYLSPAARESRDMQENYERAIRIQEQLEQEAAADIYGGKTPQETLDLFVEALRNEDIELASKYFVGEIMFDEEDNPYISKQKYLDALQQAQEEGRLQEITDFVETAEPAGSAMSGYFGFEVRGNDDKILYDIGLEFNDLADVWQIESL